MDNLKMSTKKLIESEINYNNELLQQSANKSSNNKTRASLIIRTPTLNKRSK